MSEMVHITFGRTVIAVRRDLVLPNDPTLRQQLEAKLQEYRNRLHQPQLTPHREASTNYKIWVLQQLLDQDSLDFLVLKAAVAKDATNQTLAIAYLAYAWKVIENYCFNRGNQNRGGTGLPTGEVAAIYPTVEEGGLAGVSNGDPLVVDRPSVSGPLQAPGGAASRSRVPFVMEEDATPVPEHQTVA
jgi:hypothetical protein